MKQTLQFLSGICALLLFQSCLISREPQNDLRHMKKKEVYDIRTVRLPMFLARPVLKAHLKEEDCSAELRSYVNKIKAVRVTIAATTPDFDLAAVRTAATKAPYQEWVTMNLYGNMIYISAAEKNNRIRKLNVVVAGKENAMVYAMVKCKLSPDELSAFINLLSEERTVKKWINL